MWRIVIFAQSGTGHKRVVLNGTKFDDMLLKVKILYITIVTYIIDIQYCVALECIVFLKRCHTFNAQEQGFLQLFLCRFKSAVRLDKKTIEGQMKLTIFRNL